MEASAKESKTLMERVRAGLLAVKDWLVIGYGGDTFTYRESEDHPLIEVVAMRYRRLVDPKEALELAKKHGDLQNLERLVKWKGQEAAGRN